MSYSRMMMRVYRVGLMILDHQLEQIEPDEEGVVHERNSNIDRIARFKVW
jgi:hypothetical protein